MNGFLNSLISRSITPEPPAVRPRLRSAFEPEETRPQEIFSEQTVEDERAENAIVRMAEKPAESRAQSVLHRETAHTTANTQQIHAPVEPVPQFDPKPQNDEIERPPESARDLPNHAEPPRTLDSPRQLTSTATAASAREQRAVGPPETTIVEKERRTDPVPVERRVVVERRPIGAKRSTPAAHTEADALMHSDNESLRTLTPPEESFPEEPFPEESLFVQSVNHWPALVNEMRNPFTEPGPAQAPAPQPTVHVTIGRVEIRALPANPKPSRERTTNPVMSLEEYLKQQKSGGVQ